MDITRGVFNTFTFGNPNNCHWCNKNNPTTRDRKFSRLLSRTGRRRLKYKHVVCCDNCASLIIEMIQTWYNRYDT